MVATASLCVLGSRGWIVGTQNVSFTDTGLRFDERKLVESTLSTLYGMALFTKSASWLWKNGKYHVTININFNFIPFISLTSHQTPGSRMPSPISSFQTNSICTFSSKLYKEIHLLQWQWGTIWLSKVPLEALLYRLDRMKNPFSGNVNAVNLILRGCAYSINFLNVFNVNRISLVWK